MNHRLEGVIGLLGFPRSGTTITARAIAAHPGVVPIIEPYQARRDSNFNVTDPYALADACGVRAGTRGQSLLVKETTTRSVNTCLLLDLLGNADQLGLKTGFVFVLRSPLKAFLSQADAAARYWKKPTQFGETERSLAAFHRTCRASMEVLTGRGTNLETRVVVYDAFVAQPEPVLASIMALFGYDPDHSQLNLEPVAPSFGGDPKAHASSRIRADGDRGKYDARLASLEARFANVAAYRRMRAAHHFIERYGDVASPPTSALNEVAALLDEATDREGI